MPRIRKSNCDRNKYKHLFTKDASYVLRPIVPCNNMNGFTIGDKVKLKRNMDSLYGSDMAAVVGFNTHYPIIYFHDATKHYKGVYGRGLLEVSYRDIEIVQN